MKIVRLTVGMFLAVVTAQACGGMSSQSGGSNTNWFATCSSSSDCDSGLECWCGLCTKTCASDCTAKSAAACVKPPPSCAAPSEPAKEMACAVQCTRDADCSRVDARATCVESICRIPSGASNHDSGAPLTCEDLSNRAAAAVQPILDAAERSCRSDADCTDYSGISCTNHCSKAIIAKSGLAAVQSQLDAVDQSICTRFHDQGCTVLEPPCTFAPSGCVKGTCQYTTGTVLGAPSSCADRTTSVMAAVQSLADAADKTCTVDGDCQMVLLEIQCARSCTFESISNAGVQALQSSLHDLETRSCPALGGCPIAIPECVEAPKPRCDAGACSVYPK